MSAIELFIISGGPTAVLAIVSGAVFWGAGDGSRVQIWALVLATLFFCSCTGSCVAKSVHRDSCEGVR